MKQMPSELTDVQKAELYSEARNLAAVGSIGAYERAVSILSQLRDWPGADRLATLCLRRIMELQAESRQKRRRLIKCVIIPFAVLLVFAAVMFKFVYPDMRYGSSASQQSYGSNAGMQSGISGISAERLAESDSGAAGAERSSGEGRTAMVSGYIDPDEYSPDTAHAPSQADPAGAGQNVGDGVSHRTNTASASSGVSSDTDAAGGGSGGVTGDGTASEKQQSGGHTQDRRGDNVRSSSEGTNGPEAEAAPADREVKTGDDVLPGREAVIISGAVILIILAVFGCRKLVLPALQYRRAVKHIRSGNYPEAIRIFSLLNGYRDSAGKSAYCEVQIKDGDYSSAIALKESGRLEDALAALDRLGDYKDSEKHKADCRQAIRDKDYQNAVGLMKNGSYEEAISAFRSFEGYRESEALILRCKTCMEQEPVYREAVSLAEAGDRAEAKRLFRSLRGFRDADGKLNELLMLDYEDALSLKDAGDFSAAISAFDALSDFRDSRYQIECCKTAVLEQKFRSAMVLKDEGRFEDAIDALGALSAHPKAKEQIDECKKLIRIPRPFGLYAEVGKSSPDTEAGTSSPDTERSLEEVPFLDSFGTLTFTEENGSLKSASWGADLFWKTQNTKNRGKSAEKQYRKFVAYYASLFGPAVSEYETAGHKGAWWKSPSVTVDCSTNGYISIHFDAEDKPSGQQ